MFYDFRNVIFHVTEKTLLRRVIPAVALAGHRLDNEGIAGVVTALIAVYDGGVIELRAILSNEAFHSADHEINFQVFAQFPRKNLMGTDIQNCGQIAGPAIEEQIGNIGQ